MSDDLLDSLLELVVMAKLIFVQAVGTCIGLKVYFWWMSDDSEDDEAP